MSKTQMSYLKVYFTIIVSIFFIMFFCQLSLAQNQAVSPNKTIELSSSGNILTIEIIPQGAGSVIKTPNKSSYEQSERVKLQAIASGNYSFLHWSGQTSRYMYNPLRIYMETNRTIIANFVQSDLSKITKPETPDAPSSANTGQLLNVSTGGAISNIGGQIEYIFDWGDGFISQWGDASRTHAYGKSGNFKIRVLAHSTNNPYIVSQWSSTYTINVTGTEKHILTIKINPEGAGRVEINPYKEGYEDGEIVNLRAIPYGNYRFDNWGVYTDNPINIYMLMSRTITANFKGEGGETVSIPDSPNGSSNGNVGESLNFSTEGATSNLGHEVEYRFDFGDGNQSAWGVSSSSHSYNNSSTYQVKARARCKTHTDKVSSWSGSQEVTISGSGSTYTLTVQVNPEGTGRVEVNADKAAYDYNELVQLTAIANGDYQFDHWSNDLNSNNNPVSIYMQRNRTIVANFVGEGGETVSVPDTIDGPTFGNTGEVLTFITGGSVSNLGHEVEYQFDWGDGNQSSWGASLINHSYNNGGTYQVKARARCKAHTNIVSNWSISFSVTISGSSGGLYTLTIVINPAGAGIVEKNPDKVTYDQDELVQLRAIPNDNYQFDFWDRVGGDSTINPINIYMRRDRTITANFTYGGGEETVSIPDTPTGSSNGNVGQSLNFYTGGTTSSLGHEVEYQFDWGDGDLSTWGDTTNVHIYGAEGEYFIKARARCQTHIEIISEWSDSLQVMINSNEFVSTPTTPAGPDSGYIGQSLSFITGGASSNVSPRIEYQFDWGDSILSDWGDSTREHIYNISDTLYVKSRARSQSDSSIVSEWSSAHTIIIIEKPVITYKLTISIEPIGTGAVNVIPQKNEYAPGDTVVLSPLPKEGYIFDHWNGDLTGNQNPAAIIMDENKNITAYFIEILEFVTAPTTPIVPDSGIIGQSLTFITGGASCNLGHEVEYQFDWDDGTLSDWGINTRQHTYSYSDTMKIKARGRCKVNNSVVSAWSNFHYIFIATTFNYTLTVLVDPVGTGSVNRTPYKSEYTNGETVILSPLAASEYLFSYWSGDLTGSDNPAFVIMDRNKNVTAHFKTISGVNNKIKEIPENFTLEQNYPNPYNSCTTIQYTLPDNCEVNLAIFNLQGQVINILVNEYQNAGFYSLSWNSKDGSGNNVPSGIYLYRIKTDNFSKINKMILMK